MRIKLTLLLLSLIMAAPLMAAEVTVGQKNKAFTEKKITIKQGDTVNFKNEDPFFHNVYSLSDIKTFDLGSYPKGESRAVVFDSKGTVPVECAIHPNMYMEVIVE